MPYKQGWETLGIESFIVGFAIAFTICLWK